MERVYTMDDLKQIPAFIDLLHILVPDWSPYYEFVHQDSLSQLEKFGLELESPNVLPRWQFNDYSSLRFGISCYELWHTDQLSSFLDVVAPGLWEKEVYSIHIKVSALLQIEYVVITYFGSLENTRESHVWDSTCEIVSERHQVLEPL